MTLSFQLAAILIDHPPPTLSPVCALIRLAGGDWWLLQGSLLDPQLFKNKINDLIEGNKCYIYEFAGDNKNYMKFWIGRRIKMEK